MPDRWLVLSVRVPSDGLTEELAEGLVALGGSAVQQDGPWLTTYLEPPGRPETLVAEARSRLALLAGAEPDVRWRWQPDEDWSRRWREGLAPRRVGRRVVVAQPWTEPEALEMASLAGPATVVLVIDPAMAFGTGEHATTRGALRLMEAVVMGGERVLDVGTGSGILALAAAAFGAREVLAVDSDPEAMDNARENLDRSPWGHRVRLVNAVVDREYLAAHRAGGFDLIVGNVLSGVLIPLLPSFAAALTPAGRVVLGGILESEADPVLAAAASAGLVAEVEDREAGWWTGRLRAGAASDG
jgi:ribosomal protein L11 methyltransferase